ncbi:tetraacyldisaccharide 4'-kinase [Mangrovimicrobium sediminis]|uniref:Tetraacyldisaccharide 4'-kinase n=1 Tax=Mangrovimicrobium sediminis TaxID=2562682 RepID=A0A4Z0M2V0_9GAMM|nr:tetraacyldisaccharide 4'-kinase [Haliea sp. SAOS-164]TGD73605.1 tetraacyldisaccharide 4'-kinase [Haliea sp. SAOS-164]
MSRLSAALERAWYRGAAWLWLLRPLEAVFRLLAALRRHPYRAGWANVYRAPCPVVVVGNITVGGTGKTPVVIALVEALQARGLRPGVVSRGYGVHVKGAPFGVDAGTDAASCGDEALLIARRSGAPMVVHPDRSAAVRALLAQHPVDVIVADDGLQHYALGRDFEIVLIDAVRGLGNGFCLPAGPLREPPARLRSVDRVLYRGSDDSESGVRYQPRSWVNLHTQECLPPDAFAAGEPVLAIAGIGQPAQFFATLDTLGVCYTPQVFPDHHAYTAADFTALPDKPILMTEKDAVKCAAFAGAQAWYLQIDARLPESLVAEVAALVSKPT